MDPRTKYFAFIGVSALSLLSGYLVRKRGWLHEDASERIHFHMVLWVWSVAGVLSLWVLPVRVELLWFLVMVPVLMGVTAYGAIPLARLLGCSGPQIGVISIGSGMSNTGFTLGGYLCYALLTPATDALGYSNAAVSIMLILAVPMIYPVAQHYGLGPGHGRSVWRLVRSSFFDVRAIGLYGSIVGFALAVAGVPLPRQIADWYLFDAVFFTTAIGAYFGIGLRLRFTDAMAFPRQHVLLAVMKFIVSPAVTLIMLSLIDLTPWPLPSLAWRVMMLQSFVPAAVSTVVLANLFGLDARMASMLWVWNTAIFLVVVLPAVLWGGV